MPITLILLGLLVSCVAGDPVWREIQQSSPPSLCFPAVSEAPWNASSRLVFGGISGGNVFSALWAVDLMGNNAQWTPLASSNHPPPRSGHQFTALGNSLYLFGGVNFQGYLDDFWKLSSGPSWESVQATGPLARAFFSMSRVPGALVLFGGQGDLGLFNDVWHFATNWSQLQPSPDPINGLPVARMGHAAVSYQTGIVVFGGSLVIAKPESYLNDIWQLTLPTAAWKSISPTKTAITGRWGFSMQMVASAGSASLLVFGGEAWNEDVMDDTWTFELGTGIWSRLPNSSGTPGRRMGSVLWPDTTAGALLYGGQPGNEDACQPNLWRLI